MTRGRKPKPRQLRILEGNPGKRRLPPDTRPVGRAVIPAHLTGEAAVEWARVMVGLEALGLATPLDRTFLAGYCQCWARVVECETKLTEQGLTLVGVAGNVVPNPYLAILNHQYRQMQAFGSEFGLSPASRTRVKPDETRAPSKATGTDGKAPGRFFRE